MRANGKCRQEGTSNHKQKGNAQGKARPIASKWDLLEGSAFNYEQKGIARKKRRPIASKREMLERGWDQLRAKEKCSQDGAFNYEQKRNARKTARSITSKKEMLKGRRVQLRANGKCSKEGPPNCEQKEFARRRTRPIAILNIGGCGYAPIGDSIRIVARAASIARRGSSSVGSASRGDLP